MKRRAVITSLADEEAARIEREKILEVIYGPTMFTLGKERCPISEKLLLSCLYCTIRNAVTIV